MNEQEVIDEIKLELGADVPDFELEVDDKQLERVVRKCLRELVRYWDESTMVTVPYASCIDLAGSKLDLKEEVSSIVKVYRTDAVGADNLASGLSDPAFAQQWMIFGAGGGTMYNLNDYVLNYASWNTLMQIKNTLSTDMAFKEDRHNNKLYINNYMSLPSKVTIEYIPKLKNVEDIKSDYWQDILVRLALARTKIVLGRLRTRYTQTNSLIQLDGEKILEEGNTELTALLDRLRDNSNYVYPID